MSMRGSQRIALGGLALSCGVGLWSSYAAASGLSVARFGGEHGNPVTDNATAIYYNPAGIAESEGTHVFLDLTLAWRQLGYVHTPASTDKPEPAGATGANTDKASLFNIIASPMIGVTTKLGDFALGAGLYTPFGGQATWSQNDRFDGGKSYPGPVDGAQRWFVIDGEIRSTYYTVAAAYHVPNTGLSFGVSGNLIQSLINIVRARTLSSDNNIPLEGRSWLDVSGWQGSFGAGVMVQAVPKTLWFGASYQARPNISGGMKLSGTLKNNFAGSVDGTDVDVRQDLPDTFQLGARWKARKDIELRLFGDYTRWSSFSSQCVGAKGAACSTAASGAADPGATVILNIPRNWHDTFAVRGGGSFWVNSRTEILSGAGYYSNAVPNSTLDPSIPDFNEVSLTLGGRVEVVKRLRVELSYSQFFSFSRDNSGQSTLAQQQNPSKNPDAGGAYKQSLGVANVNVDFAF